jgi:hypothetical protein
MNQREPEQLEKKSVYTLRINENLNNQVINGYLNDLVKIVKKEVKRSEVVVVVISK